MDIVKTVFVILLFVFTLGEITRFDLGNNIYVKLTDFIVVVLLLMWLIKSFRIKNNKIFRDKLLPSIIVFVGIAFVSLLVNIKYLSNSEFIVSFLYLVRWTLYSFVYFVVMSFPIKFKEKILYTLVISGALIVLFGFIQYFFYPNLRNLYYLGWDEHLYRMFSSFLDPNFAGGFFVLYLIFLAGLFKYELQKRKKLAMLIGFVFLFTLLAIYLTYSRSALVMLFVSSIVFLIVIKKVRWMIGLIIISAVFILLTSKTLENTNLFRTASIEARLDSGRNALQVIKDNILIGVGFNAYRYVQIRYKFIDKEQDPKNHAGAGTDNSFLFILATTGVIGLVSYLYLLFSILKRAYINYRATKKGDVISVLPIIVIASFVGLIIDSVFINSLFYPSIMLWMWVLTGLTDST